MPGGEDANGKDVALTLAGVNAHAMTRRRSHLEMLVCALLVAVLAVQPAAGDANRTTTNAPAVAKQQRTEQAGLFATATATTRAARAGARAQVAQVVPPTAPPDPATPAAPADPGGTVDLIPPAAPEEGDTGAPPPLPSPPTDAPTEPTVPAPDETSPAPRDPGALPSTARGEPAGSGAAAAPPATPESPASGALVPPPGAAGAAADPGTQESPGEGSPVAPGTGTGAAGRPNASARRNGSATSGATSPQASPFAGASPLTQTGDGIPASAIESPLVTQATEAITRVRPGGRSESSAPRPRPGDTVEPLQGVAGSGASDSSVGEVLVSWAKYALAILALLVVALGVNAIFAAARTRRLERQRERLMEDIGLLQAALLPDVPARLGALLTTVAYRPADGPAAGGDFYDAFALSDGRVGLLLGDVSGHGRQALAKTTLVRFTVRAHLEAGLSPREAISIAGRSLDGRLSDDFATVIAAIHDPVKGTLTYASAGHPPPIVVGPGRHQPVTVSSAPPIGVGFPTGQRQTVLPMPEGVGVMIYSDGLLEARIGGVPLGPERLTSWLEELGPDATAKAILDRVVERADRVPDDLAAVLLHASPGATAPAARIEQLKLDVLDMDGPDLDGFLTGAGVAEADRLIAGRRVSELLATTSGVIVEVRTGEHPMVSVSPIGE